MILAFLSPGSNLPSPWYLDFPHSDKIVHFAAFGIFAYILCMIFASEKQTIRILITILFGCLGYGLAIEVIQIFVPGRSFDLVDALADFIGSFLGCVIFMYSSKKALWK